MSRPALHPISVKDICDTYNICRSTLWKLCQHPDFPQVQNVRTPRLWDADAIKVFFEQGHSAQQLMAHFGISRSTWWSWRQLRGFPAPLLPGHLARWDLKAVDAFMSNQRKRSSPAGTANNTPACAAR